MTTKYSNLSKTDFADQVNADIDAMKEETPWYLRWIRNRLLELLREFMLEMIERQLNR